MTAKPEQSTAPNVRKRPTMRAYGEEIAIIRRMAILRGQLASDQAASKELAALAEQLRAIRNNA
jgi:hypothetical protein